MQDKIAWLMEAVGCEREEAQLALSMCGYDLEKAVRAIPHLLKNIVVLKGRFEYRAQNQFGLLLIVLDLKSRALLRSRAVLSFNPAAYGVSLEKGWFEFEKHLYACRLWEGSLQSDSQEIEAALSQYFKGAANSAAYDNASAFSVEPLLREMQGVMQALLPGGGLGLELKKEILDMGQFQQLEAGSGGSWSAAKNRKTSQSLRGKGPLVLKISLEVEPAGIPVEELRAGDIVSARITDRRDIASYLSKILGGYSEHGPQPIAAPVEAVEAALSGGVLVRVRLAAGVCGDAGLASGTRLKTLDVEQENASLPWWRRFFG